MKSENIEPQNTQKCAEIYNGSREEQEKSFCVFSRFLWLKKTTKDTKEQKIRDLREIRWQQKNSLLNK